MFDFTRRNDDNDFGGMALLLSVGAAAGFAAGLVLSARGGGTAALRQAGARVGSRARSLSQKLRPSRLRRQTEEQAALTRLEDAVLDHFLADAILAERGIDVGAISDGIIELSGAVRTRDEVRRAVDAARGVPGVQTVLNRLEAEGERSFDNDVAVNWDEHPGSEWSGLRSGMGRRRQGRQTEPDRPDDSQPQRERALDTADRDTWADEGYASRRPQLAARPDVREPGEGTRYAEGELDNQSPYGQRATPVPEQPQAMNAGDRVGEGLKPGTELALEGEDVPVKPHGEGLDDGGR
jgi:hypothetical protein